MFHLNTNKPESKEAFYQDILTCVKGLIEGEEDLIANMANTASVLFHSMEDVNWAGFYLLKENELVLGPFGGKPACIRIAIGKGVCGNAVAKKQTLVVKNVHEFEGHIACDSESLSEIVVPLFKGGRVIGVLDIDSIKLEKFDEVDQKYLEMLASLLMKD